MTLSDTILRLERERRAQARAALRAAASDGASVLRRAAPKSSGELRKSIHSAGPVIVIDAPHVLAVENGARPHMPPLAPILAWVKRNRARLGIKPGSAGRASNGRFTASPEVVSVAWAIAKKIEREGIKPTFFIRRSLPELGTRALKVVKEALRVRRRV